MRRVVSVWFPHWPTDRLHRRLAKPGLDADAPREAPLVTALHDGRRRVVASADQAAVALGLRPGLAMAQALALVPGLQVMEAEPEADADALRRLALWCHRYTPLVSANAPDGLWLDVAGCAHAFGDEAALLQHLLARLSQDGLHARAAVADTPGTAHALARHGDGKTIVIPPGKQGTAIGPLPVGALRLAPELEATLRRLGFEQVAHLARIPRALLARRFGPLPGLRLDQAHGRVQEPLVPLPPGQILQRRVTFLEPLLTAEALQIAIAHLVGPLCETMEHEGSGARQLDLLFERVDNLIVAVRIGTAQPSRDARHLARLLEERLDTVDPGPGIEAMRLTVPLAEPLQWEQQEGGANKQDIARLVDRLTSRLGPERVYRIASVESDIPERIVRKTPAINDPLKEVQPASPKPTPSKNANPSVSCHPTTAARCSASSLPTLRVVRSLLPQTRPLDGHRHANGHLRLVGARAEAAGGQEADTELDSVGEVGVLPWKPRYNARSPATNENSASPWPGRLQAPARLLTPPRPIKALAALPDQPPVAFTWRRRRHLIRRADGPERVQGEWWRTEPETHAIRDYFLVEDEGGQRFWLFRKGNGLDPRTGTLDWFLHGLF